MLLIGTLPSQIKSEAENRADQLLETLGEKFTTAEALKAGKQMGLERRTVEQYLTSLKDNKQIVRTKKGNYQKVQ